MNHKKEAAHTKKTSLTDENAAEPFAFPLHDEFSTWFRENELMLDMFFYTSLELCGTIN